MRSRADREERGAATAELTLALPVLVAVTMGLAWLLSVGAAQLRVVDAAREAARSSARGDGDAQAVALATGVAPDGGRVELTRAGGRVVATVTAAVDGPGGLFAFLPGVEVAATATAVDEENAP